MIRGAIFWLLLLIGAPVLAEEHSITLGSTATTEESGLFAYLLPIFKQETGIDVQVIAAGTGQALRLARRGDVDAVLIHDRVGEDDLVASGFGIDRRDVMYNDFVLVGPASDPAKLRGQREVLRGLRAIATLPASFVSRGDDSGTHRMELRLWALAGIDLKTQAGEWYNDVRSSLPRTLGMAAGIGAYSLVDRAGWANYRDRRNLVIIIEGDAALFNPYGSILVNPARYRRVNAADALIWHHWLTSTAGRTAIANFKIDGQQVYFLGSR